MNSNKAGFTVTLLSLAFIAFIGIGWVMNVATIINADFAQMTGGLILRCIGVFIVPVGGVAGWI